MDHMDSTFKEGSAVPPVDTAGIKQMWAARRHIEQDTGGLSENTAIGLGAWAGYGVEAATTHPEQMMPLMLRVQLIRSLTERGILRDYVRGEEPDEKVFAAAAAIPLTEFDLYVAFQPLMRPQLESMEPSERANLQKLLAAEGYDLEHPPIDQKFLAWLRDNG